MSTVLCAQPARASRQPRQEHQTNKELALQRLRENGPPPQAACVAWLAFGLSAVLPSCSFRSRPPPACTARRSPQTNPLRASRSGSQSRRPRGLRCSTGWESRGPLWHMAAIVAISSLAPGCGVRGWMRSERGLVAAKHTHGQVDRHFICQSLLAKEKERRPP